MSSPQRNVPQGGRVFGAGLTMAVSVGLFAYGGLWLDTRFGSRPWFLLGCVVLGIAGSMLHLIRELAPDLWPFGQKKRAGRDEHRPQPPTVDRPGTQDPDGPPRPNG